MLVLDPRAERRLVTLLRNRILPMAMKSLRLWEKGDAHSDGLFASCIAQEQYRHKTAQAT